MSASDLKRNPLLDTAIILSGNLPLDRTIQEPIKNRAIKVNYMREIERTVF